MDLKEYFEQAKGHGVLATADATGKVNAALYARPYFMDDGTVTFIMAERLTHENLKSNPWAAYLFLESGEGYSGKRLYLKKLKEEENEELINEICQRCNYSHYKAHKRYIAYFDIEKVLPLIGDAESA
ncbi:MAG: pyridoxamine 5'-phosphate oxidase family protein [Dehalococcoidia bacterium]|nr:pyridoxamine 5'-phosphate oxidase family protein [Dehalococcoidia bacterium]